MTDLLLTIVTVTKNCAVTINKTLASIRAVKVPGIEYVVVDGASSDDTLSIIRAQGNLVDQLLTEPDMGIYNAMNKGVALARGRYILFINGDDELISDGFPLVMRVLAQGRDQIVCATTVVRNLASNCEILVAKPWCLLFYNSIPHPSSFVVRELILQRPFREDLRIASDYDFFLGSYLSGKSFRVLPVVTALHHRGGASSNVLLSLQELDKVRHQRLGLYYPLLTAIASLYRRFKSIKARLNSNVYY